MTEQTADIVCEEIGPDIEVGGRGISAQIACRTGNGVAAPSEADLEQVAENADDDGRPAADTAKPSPANPSDSLRSNAETVLQRLNNLVPKATTSFTPKRPVSLAATGLTGEEVEKLVLKLMNARGSASGRFAATQTGLPYPLIEQTLKRLRSEMLITIKNAAEAGDYEFVLSDMGRNRAAEYAADCSYFGAAPVCLADYLKAMKAQSIAKQEITPTELKKAFSDLIVNPALLDRLGPAVNSGRGMFLFGEPGNGKTSLAERITKSFESTIWIPKALGIDGEIIRIFDPGIHKPIKEEESDSLIDTSDVDRRWIQIERPTVVVGGELTMSDLEVIQNPVTRICEAPVQLKSNCGTLVIDDFGRQRMPVDELLNRWIVPLEKRYDFLNLPSGKKIQVPFDQLIIFSTNLEPRDLVDGAFLRRIPYKIQVPDPSPSEFHGIFECIAPLMGFEYQRECIDYLIETHYQACGRPLRSCHPRDLLLQVKNYCTYHRLPKKMTAESFDFAVENYFSVL